MARSVSANPQICEKNESSYKNFPTSGPGGQFQNTITARCLTVFMLAQGFHCIPCNPRRSKIQYFYPAATPDSIVKILYHIINVSLQITTFWQSAGRYGRMRPERVALSMKKEILDRGLERWI